MNIKMTMKAKKVSKQFKGRRATRLSRLSQYREPVEASAALLESHPGEGLMNVKFRDTDSLRERTGEVSRHYSMNSVNRSFTANNVNLNRSQQL
jgi:hypothetical protein